MVGHIDHGKTTLLEKLTGKWTDTHSEEMKRGITIRLGYASAVIYKCPKCEGPKAYSISSKCMTHNADCQVSRMISFVDAPGHETLMATMLSGASIIHGAILVIAANEPCPQQQTADHLKALEITGIKNIIIVQNKIDLVSREQLKKNYEEIKKFVKGTVAEKAPIIPVSAQAGINVDALLQAIEEYIPSPEKKEKAEPIMLVARSFDINKPGKEVDELVGTVLGGALKQGVLKEGDEIIILPGINDKKKNEDKWVPLKTKIDKLNYSTFFVKEVVPGGSFGLSTTLDTYYGKSDKLAGSVVCLADKPVDVFQSLNLRFKILDDTVLKINDLLLINVWTSRTTGIVSAVKGDNIIVNLKLPVATIKGERVALSKRTGNRWKLSGWGEIL
ncbi:MAG: translation initiation factor IF-2 subunit gamma [Nanoarchaeota archaeon]|nr:translation initiation factor IF-2 subunit gamma [Nanoarchaeota archaeon]